MSPSFIHPTQTALSMHLTIVHEVKVCSYNLSNYRRCLVKAVVYWLGFRERCPPERITMGWE